MANIHGGAGPILGKNSQLPFDRDGRWPIALSFVASLVLKRGRYRDLVQDGAKRCASLFILTRTVMGILLRQLFVGQKGNSSLVSRGSSYAAPAQSPKEDNVRKLGLLKAACIVYLFCATTIISPAQTQFKSLYSFTGGKKDGGNPAFENLVQGPDGQLYGTTTVSTGTNGTVFKITTAGKITPLHVFCTGGFPCVDGATPLAGLLLANNKVFYGTTMGGGGVYTDGTVFQITSTGTFKSLHSFDGVDGAYPYAPLMQAANGYLYGTTGEGGDYQIGTTFEITTGGAFTPLASFNSSNGTYPYGALVQGKNGILYGTTYEKTAYDGSVFQYAPPGNPITLHSFGARQGGGLHSALIQATDGNFYGSAIGGGAKLTGGSVFRISPTGTFKVIHSFCSKKDCTDGSTPYAGLIQASDGNLYGTTFAGGANETSCNGGCGTLFKITTAGTLTTLYSFCAESDCTDGSQPQGGLVESTDGILYGTTYYGGTMGLGTVFSFPVLEPVPFVKILANSGPVGSTVIILGTNLNGATGVRFNGTAAESFTVVSNLEIDATVPAVATTGKISVITPRGTLNSNEDFVVTP